MVYLQILQDADSLDNITGEKKEGEFYIWDKSEIDEALGGEALQLAREFAAFYYIQQDGNVNLSQRRCSYPQHVVVHD